MKKLIIIAIAFGFIASATAGTVDRKAAKRQAVAEAIAEMQANPNFVTYCETAEYLAK